MQRRSFFAILLGWIAAMFAAAPETYAQPKTLRLFHRWHNGRLECQWRDNDRSVGPIFGSSDAARAWKTPPGCELTPKINPFP